MNLHSMLLARAEQGQPIRVGLIGAGKFGSMFLSQAGRTPGMHVMVIADLSPDRARANLADTGWTESQYGATTAADAYAQGTTFITEDSDKLIAAGGLDVVIEATGDPDIGIRHCLAAIAHGRHVVMVNVEADALAGPLLARKARDAGVVYSLAYGDQPALICEQVDWARTCGFVVIAAGKGTKYLPTFHASTPDTVWDHYGLSAKRAAASGMNAKMFNSFLDGTKSGIEMVAVANATGLTPAPGGLTFPACNVDEIASTLIPQDDGGTLHHKGQVEVISSCYDDGSDVPRDLRWGVYVTYEAPSDYVQRCFADYGMLTDPSGRYSALWRPYHLIGLELGISPAWAVLNNQPTGAPTGFRADVVATAKSDLKAGEMLDGEGGFSVWGRLMSAEESIASGALPIGLAHGVSLKNPVKQGQVVTWADVDMTATKRQSIGYRVRREMEAEFGDGLTKPNAAE
jgi:predicted homoserine dehydrogenase-like protein